MKISKLRSAFFLPGLGIAAGLGLLSLLWREDYNPILREMDGMVDAVQFDVLRARFSLLNNYDPLARGALLSRHLTTVSTVQTEVDDMLRTLIAPEIGRARESVVAAYEAGFVRIEARQEVFRVLLFITALALAGLVVVSFIRLRRALAALAKANATLEARVLERTAALDARTARMRLILDRVTQGLMLVDSTGCLDRERSSIVDRWHAAQDGTHIGDWASAIDRDAGAWLRMGWMDLFEDVLPFEVVADQLPKRLASANRILELSYHDLRRVDGSVSDVLVVASDITERIRQEEAERSGRDLLAVMEFAIMDRALLTESLAEFATIFDRLQSTTTERSVKIRDLHTLKGNTRMLGAAGVADACHQLEQVVAYSDEDANIPAAQTAALYATWESLIERLQPFLSNDDAIELTGEEHASLLADAATLPPADLQARIASLVDEPAARRLGRFAHQARVLARRMGKEVLVEVDDGNIRFNASFHAFWPSFIHMIRNSIDHGVELPEARTAAGKPARGRMRLRSRQDDNSTVIEVSDDGGGVNWKRVAERAVELGLPSTTAAHLEAALFAEGFTTTTEVTEISGRGVGLTAVAESVAALGGSIRVDSKPGVGTTFHLLFPRRDKPK